MGLLVVQTVHKDFQSDFLRSTAQSLNLSDQAFCERMGASWPTFQKWLLPATSVGYLEMPATAWQLVREIIAHEKRLAPKQKPYNTNSNRTAM